MTNEADREDSGVGFGQPQRVERLGRDIRRRQREAGGKAVEMLEVAPSRSAPGRLQVSQHGAVDLRELLGGHRPRGTTQSVEILGEPLGGRHQGAG